MNLCNPLNGLYTSRGEANHDVSDAGEQIRGFHQELFQSWGPQHWWPAKSAFEVIVGAYLTQNTAWTNVERALASLGEAWIVSVSGIRKVPLRKLERLIQSAGYFRQKARRLKLFVRFLDRRYSGSLAKLFAQPTSQLREELLSLEGIGPETADSILLYAGGHEVFVVDAYTRRIMERHGILAATADYDAIRRLFEESLQEAAETNAASRPISAKPRDKGAAHTPSHASRMQRSPLAQVYNEMHALIVGVGKDFCKKSHPQCDGCPLQRFLSVPK
jgi:endonuclease-3 related protein